MKSVLIQSFFWSVFSFIHIEDRDLLRKSSYSVRIQENKDQKNSLFRHFSRSDLSTNHFIYFYWYTISYSLNPSKRETECKKSNCKVIFTRIACPVPKLFIGENFCRRKMTKFFNRIFCFPQRSIGYRSDNHCEASSKLIIIFSKVIGMFEEQKILL